MGLEDGVPAFIFLSLSLSLPHSRSPRRIHQTLAAPAATLLPCAPESTTWQHPRGTCSSTTIVARARLHCRQERRWRFTIRPARWLPLPLTTRQP
jgi:hypothetical protein